MKILVCGSRYWNEPDDIYEVLGEYEPDLPTIVHGDARGADTIAAEAAEFHGYPTLVFRADWKKHGRAAGPIRNRQMLDEEPDLVIAFGDGRGTADCVDEAERRGIPVRRVPSALRTSGAPE